jgi:hypothetical protein
MLALDSKNADGSLELKSTAPLLGDKTRHNARNQARRQNFCIQVALGITSAVFGTLFVVFLVLHRNALADLKAKKTTMEFESKMDLNLADLSARLNRLAASATAQVHPVEGKTSAFWSGLATASSVNSLKTNIANEIASKAGSLASTDMWATGFSPRVSYLKGSVTFTLSELLTLIQSDGAIFKVELIAPPGSSLLASSVLADARKTVFVELLRLILEGLGGTFGTGADRWPAITNGLILEKLKVVCNNHQVTPQDALLTANAPPNADADSPFSVSATMLRSDVLSSSEVYAAVMYLDTLVAKTAPEKCLQSFVLTTSVTTNPGSDTTIEIDILVDSQKCTTSNQEVFWNALDSDR